MLRFLIVPALLATATVPAAAQSRPDSLALNCAQARDIVARNGAVVMGSGPLIYDRFVASVRFCPLGDVTRPATVPTRDTPYCPVGNTCIQPFSERQLFAD